MIHNHKNFCFISAQVYVNFFTPLHIPYNHYEGCQTDLNYNDTHRVFRCSYLFCLPVFRVYFMLERCISSTKLERVINAQLEFI